MQREEKPSEPVLEAITYYTPGGRWPATDEDYAALAPYLSRPDLYCVSICQGIGPVTRGWIRETKNPTGTYRAAFTGVRTAVYNEWDRPDYAVLPGLHQTPEERRYDDHNVELVKRTGNGCPCVTCIHHRQVHHRNPQNTFHQEEIVWPPLLRPDLPHAPYNVWDKPTPVWPQTGPVLNDKDQILGHMKYAHEQADERCTHCGVPRKQVRSIPVQKCSNCGRVFT